MYQKIQNMIFQCPVLNLKKKNFLHASICRILVMINVNLHAEGFPSIEPCWILASAANIGDRGVTPQFIPCPLHCVQLADKWSQAGRWSWVTPKRQTLI